MAGLKAGDEILEINKRAAGTLNSSVLRDFLAQPSLGLLVRTCPELEGGAELLENPPHRLDGPADLGESPLAFLSSDTGMAVPWGCPSRPASFCGFPASGRSCEMPEEDEQITELPCRGVKGPGTYMLVELPRGCNGKLCRAAAVCPLGER